MSDGYVHKPVKWAHQPLEIRRALRAYRLRPISQLCHMNSQRLYVYATELRERLAYHEGVVGPQGYDFYFEHAWLTFDGEILDLTLDRARYRYGDSFTVTADEI